MELKPGYKQTEVGIIPEEWEVSTVGREFNIKLGKMLDAEKNFGLLKPYLGNKAVQWDRIDSSNLPTVPMSRPDIERYRLQDGDLLVCEGGEVGRAAIWDAPIQECYYQKALHRLRPVRGFDSRLMVALLRFWSEQGRLANYVTQTSIAHLPREIFLEVPMPVPPLSEQHAIAAALSDVDALLGGLDRLIAKKRDLKQAAMQQLLTGQTRLPGFHGDWEVKTLGELATIKDGTHQTPKYVLSGVPFFSVEQVTSGDFTNTKFISEDEHRFLTRFFQIERDDILMTRIGSIGDCKLIDWDVDASFYVSLALLKIRPGYSAAFITQYSNTTAFKKEIELHSLPSAIPKKINLGPISNIRIELPPTLPEQTAIAAVLSDMDDELVALEARRDKTRDLKQAMMQELLTGKTRLVPVGAAHA
jgi:type I restriction enzyme, S subunit